MATKEENQKRLRQLAGLLGREADMSGSAADIAQRVSEWEEELAASRTARSMCSVAGSAVSVRR
ncbi:DNA packaging protein [Escherichia coli]|nr:DNA packaging protein [Escherichia coli]